MASAPPPPNMFATQPMRPSLDSFGGTGTVTYLNRLPLKRPSIEAYIAAGALAAVALVGGVALLAALGLSSHSAASSSDGAPAHVARTMVIAAANEGTILKPLSSPEKAGGSSSTSTSNASSSDAPAVAAPASGGGEHVSAPPAVATPAPKRAGVIRVSPLLRGVLVDGAPHAVHGGSVVVTCGRHTVKAPGGSAHTVDVPCGGSTSI
jgi:hypothetical protein